MCGRYSWFSGWGVLEERFGLVKASEPPELPKPRYNAAPGQLLPIIKSTKPKELIFARWGLLPSWLQGKSGAHGLINARAETAATKPAFRMAFKARHCLVLADSFFEWQRQGRTKVPWRILLKSSEPFAFAGLWEPGAGDEPATFTILTTEPNELVRPIHDRMPVILERPTESHWLATWLSMRQQLDLLHPYPAEGMQAYPVTSLVNSPANNTPEILEPA